MEAGIKCDRCGIHSEVLIKKRGIKEYRCMGCMRLDRKEKQREDSLRRARLNYKDPIKRYAQVEKMREYYKKPEVIERMKSEEYLLEASKSHTEYRNKNRDRFRASNRRAYKKWLLNPTNKLSAIMSSRIRRGIGGIKNNKHWEDLVGYTLEQLKQHLESLFEPGMSWKNHGPKGWHIDHIIPVSSFSFKSVEDEEFKRCWSLENTSPRWATTSIARQNGSNSIGNINKSNKILPINVL